jgi:regulator of RNase E activity RraA
VNEAGSSIYFTTNGTNPTATAANKYSTAITLTAAMTLKYFAVDPSNNSSAIVSQAYTVTAPPANTWRTTQATPRTTWWHAIMAARFGCIRATVPGVG